MYGSCGPDVAGRILFLDLSVVAQIFSGAGLGSNNHRLTTAASNPLGGILRVIWNLTWMFSKSCSSGGLLFRSPSGGPVWGKPGGSGRELVRPPTRKDPPPAC